MSSTLINVNVLGSGPTGALLALALANAGCKVFLYDPVEQRNIISRNKSYALTHSSRRLLQELDIWNDLSSKLNSFNKLLLADLESNKSLTFTLSDLCSNNSKSLSLGWTIEHKFLMNILFERINNNSYIITKNNNKDMNGSFLTFAADGYNSTTRNKLGIGFINSRYRQACLTAKVLIRNQEKNIAYELFRADGPLALLPIGNNIYQIFLTSSFWKCEYLENISPTNFLDYLSGVLPHGIEPDVLIESPKTFLLNLSLASILSKHKVVLVGESAHCCHPVGGQGLNLCWRDVNTVRNIIINVNKGKIPFKLLPLLYQILRFFDILFVLIFTDTIVRIFSNRVKSIILLRNILLKLLTKVKTFRRIAFKVMTDGPLSILSSH